MRNSLFLLTLFLLTAVGTYAQEPIFLFDDYVQATFRLKHNVVTKGKVNIDVKYQKLYYLDGEQVMEMTNCFELDTLYVRDRKFVWKNSSLCEYVRRDYGILYVNWRLRDTPVGKIGAMGTVTRQKVEVMQVPGLNSEYSYGNVGKYSDRTDVWTVRNENVYYLLFNGREYRITRLSDLYRQFPEKADDIKRFVREHNYTMKSMEEAEKIFDYVCA